MTRTMAMLVYHASPITARSSTELRRYDRATVCIVRAVAVGLACISLVLPSCNTPSHQEVRIDKEKDWNHVRARVKFQLAEQQYHSGLLSEATDSVEEALQLDPEQADACVLLARIHLEQGKPASAEQTLEEARHLGLESPEMFYTEGVLLERRGRLEKASERFSAARQLDPKQLDYLVAQAECLVGLDRPEDALTLLDDYATSVDDDGTLSVLASRIAVLMGDADDAIHRLRRSVVPPGSRQAVAEELGLLLVRTSRFKEAVTVLESLIAEDPHAHSLGSVHHALAKCYLMLGHAVAAKELLQPYAQSHPTDARTQLLLAQAAMATDDILLAMQAVDAAKRQFPNRPEVHFVEALVNWKRNRIPEAVEDVTEVLRASPDDVDAHCLLGELHSSQHRLDKARFHFQRALELDPTNAWAARSLAGL